MFIIIFLLITAITSVNASLAEGREKLTQFSTLLRADKNEEARRLLQDPLFQNPHDINAYVNDTEHNATFLSEAARYGDLETVKAVVALGANVKVEPQENHPTPLFSACKNKKWAKEIIGYFLDLGANGTQTEDDGKTLLHQLLDPHLIEDDQYCEDVIRFLLEKVPNLNVNALGGYAYRTPLYIARTKNIAQLFLDKGALLTVQDEDGNTPLHHVIETYGYHLIDLFISHSQNVCIRNHNHETPLHVIPFYETNNERSFNIAKQLLIKDPNLIYTPDKWGNTPLHRAAGAGNTQLVKFFIRKKAPLNSMNNKGDTPLHYVIRHGHTSRIFQSKEVAEVLIKKGASLEIRNAQGLTPLHIAAFLGKGDVVELLLKHKANVNAENNAGNTPLHYAATYGYTAIAQALIEKGAEINKQNWSGLTPLHSACSYRQQKVVQLLKDKGASLTIKDHDQQTPEEKEPNNVIAPSPTIAPLPTSEQDTPPRPAERVPHHITQPRIVPPSPPPATNPPENDPISIADKETEYKNALSIGIILSLMVGGIFFYKHLQKKRSLSDDNNDLFNELNENGQSKAPSVS